MAAWCSRWTVPCDLVPPSCEAGSLAILSKDQMQRNLYLAFSSGPWSDTWLLSFDRLDLGMLRKWPALCELLTHRCSLCDIRPVDLVQHLRLHHAELWEQAEPLSEKLLCSFAEMAIRICACQPYYRVSMDDHVHVYVILECSIGFSASSR